MLIRDPRPFAFFPAFGAVYGDNPQGIDPPFRTNPAARFQEVLDFAAGITSRVVLSMPQGQTTGNAFGAACQEVLAPTIRTWVENTTPTLARSWDLELYTGSFKGRVAGVPTQSATSQDTGPEISATNIVAADVAWYVQDCVRIFAQAGWKRLWLDAMYIPAHYDTVDALNAENARRGFFPSPTAVEPFPLAAPGVLDAALCRRAPSCALERNFIRTQDPSDQWVAPTGSEMHVIIDDQFGVWADATQRAKIDSWIARNFIVSMNGGAPLAARRHWATVYGSTGFSRKVPAAGPVM